MTHAKQKSDAVGEFDLIDRFFSHIGQPPSGDVMLGVGDDAALVSCGRDSIVLTVDTLVSGVHFYPDDPPESIAHKALMVNLSDLSAMGAVPFAFLLSLTLPEANETWLTAFSQALHTQALRAQVTLIGGDTTHGPLSVSITALGRVNRDQALKRSNAKPGDNIYITGELGLAAFYVYARDHQLNPGERATQAYRFPDPPIRLGHQLCGLAHAAIDISDGLFADLSHILTASHVGAHLMRESIPIASEWSILPSDDAFRHAVTSGDDYVLCFTAPKSAAASINAVLIGEICEGEGIQIGGKRWTGHSGYDHFI
jgi:thiamine-monophosphate kinase